MNLRYVTAKRLIVSNSIRADSETSAGVFAITHTLLKARKILRGIKLFLMASCKTPQNLALAKLECETAPWLFHFSK